VGYSPERVNPGDKENRVANIKKVTSGSTPETALAVDALYSSIIMAGTHLAPTIKVAEAAKVIENAQRDINIAFVNELAKIFNVLNIDTREVLEAAKTKWNFLPFEPGLVGGNCIGVDPYYLAQRAQQAGYHSEIILAGRRMNDGMGQYVATEVIKMMMKSGTPMKRAKILMLGIAFKENCSDIGNTRVVDIYNSLRQFDLQIDVFDPYVDRNQVKSELGIDMIDAEKFTKYDMIILAVAHDKFLHMDLGHMKSENGLVYDVKGVLEQELVDKRL
jgi:UDP-N-acetyl-D-galactosamine dehydrogenase